MNLSHRIFLAAALSLSAAAPAFAEPTVNVFTRCFQFSEQAAKLVQLRLLVSEDGSNDAAFVRYVGAKSWIPLVLSKRSTLEMAQGSGKEEVDTDWLEVFQGKVTGRYGLGTFGAEVVFFEYVNGATGKKTEFKPAFMPRGVDPCETATNPKSK